MRFPISFDIAGLKYYCTPDDVGQFAGYAVPEPTNEYDPDAVAIYANPDRLVGYIPRDRTEEFRWWCHNAERVPCKIAIKYSDVTSQFSGTVKLHDDATVKDWDLAGMSVRYFRSDECDNDPFHMVDVPALLAAMGLKSIGPTAKHIDIATFFQKPSTSLTRRLATDDTCMPIELSELIGRALPADNRIDITGKTVAFAYKSMSDSDKRLMRYLVEKGVTIAPRYTKGTTDIVLDRDINSPLAQTQKAIADGKEVYSTSAFAERYGVLYVSQPTISYRLERSEDSEATGTATLSDLLGAESAEMMSKALNGGAKDSPAVTDDPDESNGSPSAVGCIALVVVAVIIAYLLL